MFCIVHNAHCFGKKVPESNNPQCPAVLKADYPLIGLKRSQFQFTPFIKLTEFQLMGKPIVQSMMN